MTRYEWERALLTNSRDVILVLDERGRIEFVDTAGERIAGYDPEAVLGDDAFEHVPEADKEAVRTAFSEVIAGPMEWLRLSAATGTEGERETAPLPSPRPRESVSTAAVSPPGLTSVRPRGRASPRCWRRR